VLATVWVRRHFGPPVGSQTVSFQL
jgi:hypothetical protein